MSPSRSAGLWRRALDPSGPVGAQVVAQACNLGGQLAVAVLAGGDLFGSAGLALMAAATTVFVGDLGYGTFFLRHAATNDQWLPHWRAAAGQRLLVLVVAVVVALMVCHVTAPHPDVALVTVLSAAPGMMLSAFLPTQLLFALDRPRAAALGQVLRFAVQAAVSVAVAVVAPGHADAGLGAGFTLGIVAQLAAGLAVGLPLALLRPAFVRLRPEIAALRVWLVSLAGVVHDRTLPFLAAAAMPEAAGWVVIVTQVLQSGVALLSQVDRLLVPDQARAGRAALPAAWPAEVAALTLGLTAVLAWSLAPTLRAAGLLAAVEWYGLVLIAWSYSVAFAAGREKRFALVLLAALPLSILVQVLAAPAMGLVGLMVWRATVALLLGWIGAALACGPRHGMPLSPPAALAGAAGLLWVLSRLGLSSVGTVVALGCLGLAATLCWREAFHGR